MRTSFAILAVSVLATGCLTSDKYPMPFERERKFLADQGDSLRRDHEAAKSKHDPVKSLVIDPPVLNLKISATDSLAQAPSQTVRIEPLADDRTVADFKLIGKKTAAFKVQTHRVYLAREPVDVLHEAISQAWKSTGHQVTTDDATVIVRAKIVEFKVDTPYDWETWDAAASIEVDVKAFLHDDSSGYSKRYKARQTTATIWGPQKDDFQTALRWCIEDVVKDIATDADLAHYLSSGPQDARQ